MAGKGRGKARKISNDIIIDSDSDDAGGAVVDNHRTAGEEHTIPLAPEINLASDEELSDHSLPETVSIDKLQDVPGQRGVKRKISALAPSKGTSTSKHKCSYY